MNGISTKITDCEDNRMTNYERIKNMSVEDMARENVYFLPNNIHINYTGLSGNFPNKQKQWGDDK